MEKLYRIGEVSKICEIPIKTLRFYEEEGLIKPVQVDMFTGYRYYDDENILEIYRVKLLKNLGFSLKEIREFDEKSLDKKIKDIKSQVNQLKDKRAMISYLQKQKGEKIMKPFINDEKAIGKWNFIAQAKTKEDYDLGNFSTEKTFINILYFLPNGKGYWAIERWSKGEVYHFTGETFTYEIEGNKLYLNVKFANNSNVLVFEKESSKEYTLEEIEIKDNVDIDFVMDKNAVGLWETVGFVDYEKKENFSLEEICKEKFLKTITINPNGECIYEFKNNALAKRNWSKGKIVNKQAFTVSDYEIKEINGEKYMIVDWKSGDYSYQGYIDICYVLKKF